jgi:hypothetical protein
MNSKSPWSLFSPAVHFFLSAPDTPDTHPMKELRTGYNERWCPRKPAKNGEAMPSTKPRYSMEEFAQRGEAIYERDIRPALEPGHEGEFVAIDIETGAYEVDADELAASDRLLARIPNAQTWLRRVGSRYARHFGPRGRSTAP